MFTARYGLSPYNFVHFTHINFCCCGFLLFLSFLYILYVSHKLNFIMLSSRLSKTRHGRNIISLYFFLFITGRAKCLSREQCVE